mmetsp:Transcript_18887/g.23032  ORF Transcript_18887/g.23032 Transcript_18887/m.23032 type:complete len:177 (-) Transcript_18887:328-858(-)
MHCERTYSSTMEKENSLPKLQHMQRKNGFEDNLVVISDSGYLNPDRWEGLPWTPSLTGRRFWSIEENLARNVRVQWCCFIPFSRKMTWVNEDYEAVQKVSNFENSFCCYCKEDKRRQLLRDPYDDENIVDKSFCIKCILCSPVAFILLPIFCDCSAFCDPQAAYGQREIIPKVQQY